MAAANAQIPDSDDEELGMPLGQQPAASSASVPVATNPFPLNSPAGSPTNADPARAILEQLAATTQLLSNIVLNQNPQQQPAQVSVPPGHSSSAGFSDANKVLNRPDGFGSTSHESDLSAWQDWSHAFKNWLSFADSDYENFLEVVEKNLDTVIDVTKEPEHVQVKGRKLYAVLSSLLKNKPRTLLKQVENRNGWEVWRQLQNIYAPKTRARSLAVLNALTGAPSFTKDKTLQEQVFALERISAEYTRVSGNAVGEDVMLGTLLRCLPQAIRNHVQLVMTDKSTYSQVRAYVLSYEITTTSWSPQRVQQALGVTGAPHKDDQGPTPMEIDMVTDKGKGKGKSKDKGKGKGHHGKSGKGKSKDKGKGKGAKKGGNVDAQSCLYCHKKGHWKRDCRKLKSDIARGIVTSDANGVVRAVEQAVDSSSVASTAAVSTVAPSHSASNVQPKRIARVQLQPQVFQMDAADGSGPVDLTIFDISQGDAEMDFGVNMISKVDSSDVTCLEKSDAALGVQNSVEAAGLPCTCKDGSVGAGQVDLETMYAALDVCNKRTHDGLTALDACNVHVHSVRALQKRAEVCIDIILDSGADCSALPLEYAHIGCEASGRLPMAGYVDAQGNALNVKSTRDAEVTLGGTVFKERFVVAPVTSPLICLGHLYKAGYFVQPCDGGLVLTNGVDSIPMGYRNQSFVIKGTIRMLAGHMRAVNALEVYLLPKLEGLRGSWTNVGQGVLACKAMSQTFVDTTLVPVSSVRWYRTTLVQRQNKWYLAEFAEDISRLEALDAPLERPEEIEAVITMSYDDPDLVPAALGFEMVSADSLVPSGQVLAGSGQVPAGSGQGLQPMQDVPSEAPGIEVPADSQVPSGQVPAGPPNAIQVGEVTVTAGASHAVLKAACSACGISTSGNRGQLWSRLSKHVVHQESLTEHGVAHTLERESTRQPIAQAIAVEPSAQQVHEHNLTHYPYQEWCPVCVCFKGRQDQHPASADHTGSSVSVLSFDYGFLSLRTGGDAMTALFAVDRQTKAVIGIPAKTKAGPSLSHTVTELTRFINWIGHNEIRLRCDNENPITKVAEATKRACRACGIRVQADTTPIDAHEANPAEQTLQVLRQQACILVKQAEQGGLQAQSGASREPQAEGAASRSQAGASGEPQAEGAAARSQAGASGEPQAEGAAARPQAGASGEPQAESQNDQADTIFGINHPVWSWALLHASWLRNRFHVEHGETAYERATGMTYGGKVCLFGERVMGFLKTNSTGKAAPRWVECIWLGKTMLNDVNIVWSPGSPGGIFVTRSIRRFAQPWDIKMLSELEVCAWEHGYANLGGVLVPRKRVAPPVAAEVPIEMPMMVAPPTNTTTSESPYQQPFTPDEAGSDPPSTPLQYAPSSAEMSLPGQSGSLSPMSGAMSATEQVLPETGLPPGQVQGASGQQVPGAARPGSGAEVQAGDGGDNVGPVEAIDPRPPTRRRVGHVDLITCAGDRMSDCALNAICLIAEYDDLQSVCQIGELTLEHEDGVPEFVLDASAADNLEDYEFSLDDDPQDDDSGQELDPRLCLPRYDDSEPWMSAEALADLDDIADQHELDRLQRMQVLLPPESLDGCGQQVKHLSTKMVRSWREKEDAPGNPIWLRRSRYVAREFNWMAERSDCFSPASSAVANKLLPILALQKGYTLAAIDVSDAFLTVQQKEPTLVEYVDKSGNRQSFALGRLLPGQRDGSKEWYHDFVAYLHHIVKAETCLAYPSLLRTPLLESIMQLHVDDVLVASLLDFLEHNLVAGLKRKYKISVQILTQDNAITFLKKRHVLLPGNEILIFPHPKHFEKLFALHGVKEGDCCKKTPYDPKLDEPDTSTLLEGTDASIFRTSLGILLYLSPELLECQNAIRALSAYMAGPTRQAMVSLRHLVKYLLGVSGNGLKLRKVAECQGHAGWYDDPITLETMSDSDWASSKGHRRSISSSMVFVAGNLLYSASRCQRLVSLSSAEAEVHAATSTMCDGLFTRLLIEFCTGHMPRLHHHLDSTAAMGILQRSGVGRIRHLSTRVLWTQAAVADGKVALHKIGADVNCADLGTKHMVRSRMRMLQYLLGACDAYGNPVGEDDFLDFTAKQQFKKAVKAVRQVAPGQAKVRVRQIMLAALVSMANAGNALSPDDEPNSDANVADGEHDDLGDGWMSPMMSLVSDAMAWMIVLYEQYPGLFTVVVQITLLILAFMIFGLCSQRRPVAQRQTVQQDHDQASTGSQSPHVFSRPLNINIHMHQSQPVPGTPAMPYNLSESESMNASAAEGASSSEPGIAGMSTASSSGADVPVLNPVPEGVPAARSKAAPKQVARRLETVWIPRGGGKKYHRMGCGKLNCSHRVDELTVQDARARGFTACKVCQPTTE